MALGSGIFLLVLGAVLAFAVGDNIDAVNVEMIGYICIGAGVLAIVLSLVMNAQRSNTSHKETVERTETKRGDEPR